MTAINPNPRQIMKRPAIPFLLLGVLVLGACGAADEEMGASAETTADTFSSYTPTVPTARGAAEAIPQPDLARADGASSASTVPGAAQAATLDPMLVRTGEAVIRVDSLDPAIARVRQLVQRAGGIVGNTAITAGTDEVRRAEMELRIPTAGFDAAVDALSSVGQVQSVNVTASDVGEEYTDVTARVANARRVEARLLELMDARNGQLEEVLHLEREVARVRQEIERHDGRLRYLSTRASVSVITVTLHEGHTPGAVGPGERPIRDALLSAWSSFIRLVAGLISALGVLIPLVVLAVLAWRGMRWLKRRETDLDAVYREALRRERERPASAPPAAPADADADEPALRG
jgi:HAMP domain-containing protein